MRIREPSPEFDGNLEQELIRKIGSIVEPRAVIPVAARPDLYGIYVVRFLDSSLEDGMVMAYRHCLQDGELAEPHDPKYKLTILPEVVSGLESPEMIHFETTYSDTLFINGQPFNEDGHSREKELLSMISAALLEPEEQTASYVQRQEMEIRDDPFGLF